MKMVSTSIRIGASPERVWGVLTDFAEYPSWNPFMVAISGSPAAGSKLNVRISPPGGKPMSFKPTILVAKKNKELRWRGRLVLPGVFDGEHYFRLSPASGGTLLDHGESFSGLIVRLLGSGIFEKTRNGFVAMNEALKKKVEG